LGLFLSLVCGLVLDPNSTPTTTPTPTKI